MQQHLKNITGSRKLSNLLQCIQTTLFFQANDSHSSLIPNKCAQRRAETRNYLLQLHKINTLSYLAIIQVTFLCNVAMGTHCLFAVTVRQTIKLVSFVF